MIKNRPKQVIIGRVLKTKTEKYVYLYKYGLKDRIKNTKYSDRVSSFVLRHTTPQYSYRLDKVIRAQL